MAYYDDSQDEKALDPNAQPEQQPGQQGSSVISGQGDGGGSNAPAAASAPGGGEAAGSSPFVGIKQYLDANKAQSAKLATDTAGLVNTATQQARESLAPQTNLYNQAVEQNTVKLDQPLFDEAKSHAETVANDAGKKANFIKMRDATYQGPQSFQGSEFYQPVQQAFQNATEKARDTGTEEGQAKLLSDLQQQTRGKVNQSAINLDRALLRSDQARGILGQSVKAQADLPTILQEAEEKSVAKANEAKDTTDATRNAVQAAFSGDNGVQKNLEKAIQSRVAPLEAQGKKEAKKLAELIKSGAKPTADQLKVLGISKKQYDELKGLVSEYNKVRSVGEAEYTKLNTPTKGSINTYGSEPGTLENEISLLRKQLPGISDLSKFITKVNPGITAQQVATPEEYARYAALNSLMGTGNGFLNDPSQAGTASNDSVDFQFNKAKESLTQSVKSAQKALANARAKSSTRLGVRQHEIDSDAAKQSEQTGSILGAGIGTAISPGNGTAIGAVVGAKLGKQWKI